MINEETIRAMIREMIRQELEENSTSGATPGYMTPNAFQGTSEKGKRKHDDNVDKTREYTVVENDESTDPVNEGRSHYLDYKNKGTANSIQRIGKSITEINRSLTEVERAITMASRLKTETNTTNDQLWKRSLKHLMKIEGRILKMAHALRELKQ
jgi:hypothetical protein